MRTILMICCSVLMLAVSQGTAKSAEFTDDAYEINGAVVTCTNRCVTTTNPDGSTTVRDCCGGRVSIRFTSEK